MRQAGTTFPSDVDAGNFEHAREFLKGAGPAVLLVEQAYPALARLSRELAPPWPGVPASAPRGGWFDGSIAMLSGLEITISVVEAALPLTTFRSYVP